MFWFIFATPTYDANSELKKNFDDPVAQSKYAHIIGNLMLFMNFIRHDVVYDV